MRLVDQVLASFKWNQCLAYLDDALVFGGSPQEHNARLECVIKALEAVGLKFNAKKCQFGIASVLFWAKCTTRMIFDLTLGKLTL